jgi:hypothetical protein
MNPDCCFVCARYWLYRSFRCGSSHPHRRHHGGDDLPSRHRHPQGWIHNSFVDHDDVVQWNFWVETFLLMDVLQSEDFDEPHLIFSRWTCRTSSIGLTGCAGVSCQKVGATAGAMLPLRYSALDLKAHCHIRPAASILTGLPLSFSECNP